MYLVNIPVNCDKFFRAKDKNVILKELKEFDADRVFLNFETALDGHVVRCEEKDFQKQMERMKEACAFFKSHGYEVGAWFWGLQFDKALSFTKIKTLQGKETNRFACPTDEDFLETFSRCLQEVVKTGVDIILINDDLRFGAWSGFGCLCKNHVKMICESLGESLTEESLKEKILSGGKNVYRDAFLKANRESRERYAKRMRRAVNEIDPRVRIGCCAAMTAWDIDGDAFELARLFAGDTKPLLRLVGAPYWAVGKSWGNRLQDVIELERMEAGWNPNHDVELIAEGDVYPRPRHNCPASYLEGFDTALRASGALDGILRSCVDYVSNVGYENGYLNHYRKNKPLYDAIQTRFDGKKPVGVRIYESQKKVSVMEMPNALGETSDPEECFYSIPARILAANAVPAVYEGKGSFGIAFGESAYALDEDAFEKGMVLDALAAKILSDRGVDVGIERFGEKTPIRFQYFPEDDNYVIAQRIKMFDVKLKPAAQVISFGASVLEEAKFPFSYRYENEKGQKFLVFCCIGKDCEKLLFHYANAKTVEENARWLSGEALPAFCYGHPNLYMLCKEDEESTVIGLWNFFEDEALSPVVQLGREYQRAEFFSGSGKLSADRVDLDSIPPFGFCGICLKK